MRWPLCGPLLEISFRLSRIMPGCRTYSANVWASSPGLELCRCVCSWSPDWQPRAEEHSPAPGCPSQSRGPPCPAWGPSDPQSEPSLRSCRCLWEAEGAASPCAARVICLAGPAALSSRGDCISHRLAQSHRLLAHFSFCICGNQTWK